MKKLIKADKMQIKKQEKSRKKQVKSVENRCNQENSVEMNGVQNVY